MSEFTGRWFTTFGPMELTQKGSEVCGTYGRGNSVEGVLEDGKLQFRYAEPHQTGTGWFALARAGKFTGEYLADGAEHPRTWEGQRGFDGVWDSSFGRLRIIQEEKRIFGFYEGLGSATIEGKLKNGRFVFTYQEPKARGEGRFELADDGVSFTGEWRPQGRKQWGTWLGRRVAPTPGLIWLVVLEAHWQRSLADNEYAFGHMLREFFARLEHVRVRQRFFHDEASLQHWCRELLYLPEPAILMIASHGTPEGLSVHGNTIDTERVFDSVQYADNLRLLHFSSCLVLHDGADAAGIRAFRSKATFPISGYTTSVDWGGSALIEFTYIDLILGKHLTPAQAADLLPRLVNFAGDDVIPESPYAAAGFRFFAPKKEDDGAILWAGM